MYILSKRLYFPPVSSASSEGIVAVGGDLSVDRIRLAYNSGIFPWYNPEDEPILWWSPDPRFVLFLDKLKVSKSMQQVIKSPKFEFRINTSFTKVIENCRDVYREGQDGTWLSDSLITAFTQLHREGIVHCAEAWQGQQLVGGLYGVQVGKVFCGESMFSLVSNASKFAFIQWVKHLQSTGTQLIDCQVYTPHLASLGAEMISREAFMKYLSEL
ncbi:MAG: leucyl/phenylalanyl-tRNA--protein transferase [Chitinophagia bacterium]|nr:leucyl/phenylalanyl-tRNA--protein transferase [Chitinophagia bacterium]